MTVKQIFELRKEGRIEEAYEAIKPMYAVHKGKYTSICMFWTASDIFKLRLEQGRIDEATKIFHALKRVLPYVNDSEGIAMAFMQSAARRLSNIPRQSEGNDSPQETISNHPEDSEACEKSTSDGSCSSDEDFSGRLVVGLDEGIVDRPYDKISDPRSKVLDYIKASEGCSIPKITAATGIPARSVARHVSALVAQGLIEHRGSNKTGGYYIV